MKWEYKTIKLRAKGLLGGKTDEVQLDAMMNQLGGQGWEDGLGPSPSNTVVASPAQMTELLQRLTNKLAKE